ncbi:inositol monophosphatase [Nocardiopsis tropica]|uniref:inositol monophosphatase family protein n=1 Tax=Tsukamurella TaxID=2060 RepID=UPI001C7CEB02|nr:inositol monophosphatase [Tsukamurella sp. TY48]GIZ98924.1 inositol-1-monophosphatase ImpA [Tsukamurella sp. TY48]
MAALPTGFTGDPDRLLAAAGAVLDGISPRFIEGVGAPASVTKGPADFATDLDLELERRITGEIADATGIPVHGEEFGGPPVDEGTVWILDPIDGTFNYSAGFPATGTLLGLVHDGRPVAGLAWFPLVGDSISGHVAGQVHNRGVAVPPLAHKSLVDSMIAVGSFSRGSNGHFPGDYRFAILGEVSRRVARVRQFGSTGVDLAYTATGVFGGAVVFGHHPWDNAAGAALVIAGGGRVTDLAGAEWHTASDSVLAGGPGVYDELLDIVRSVGAPSDFRGEPGHPGVLSY